MKPIILPLAAGLILLAGCGQAPAEQAIDNAVDRAAEAVENAADALDAAAGDAAHEIGGDTLGGAAENRQDGAANTGERAQ